MNNTIVICGGSSGIGYDTAKLFLEKKCNVIISSRNKTKLSEAHKQLTKEYPDGNILCYPADMSNFTDAYLLFEYATTKYSNINTLVNSCGMWSSKSISELNNKDISVMFKRLNF
jgi:short-subunit dehydrogenase